MKLKPPSFPARMLMAIVGAFLAARLALLLSEAIGP